MGDDAGDLGLVGKLRLDLKDFLEPDQFLLEGLVVGKLQAKGLVFQLKAADLLAQVAEFLQSGQVFSGKAATAPTAF